MSLKKIDMILLVIVSVAFFLLFVLITRQMYLGKFPFWFDPARDMGLGLENLGKLRLIGHPAGGLSGIFYGPYYIWLISLAEAISKDPRWVYFAFCTLSYFIAFPLVLLLFRQFADVVTIMALCVVFAIQTPYATQLWNPTLVPIFYLSAIYIALRLYKSRAHKIHFVFVLGLIAGLINNFHMSLGTGILISFGVYILIKGLQKLISQKKDKKNNLFGLIFSLCTYGAGIAVTYIPFLFFEIRHGFNQIKVLTNSLYLMLIKGQTVNFGVGYSKPEVVHQFFLRGEHVLFIPWFVLLLLFVFFSFLIMRNEDNKRDHNKSIQIEVTRILIINTVCILTIYLVSKNPIYDYFFIGVEVIFLVFFLIWSKNISFLKYVVVLLALGLFTSKVFFEISFFGRKDTSSNYASKLKVVETIYADAKKEPFSMVVYDAAIYTYDFDYILGYVSPRYGYSPDRTVKQGQIAYIVLPKGDKGALESFASYHTPKESYATLKRWVMDDETVVLKQKEKKFNER